MTNQPIVDTASGVVAVCNGEIDNHHELRRWLAERGRPVHRKRTWRSSPVCISNSAKRS
jgi:asparagine synthetase B (glutamine-hydrolysing)